MQTQIQAKDVIIKQLQIELKLENDQELILQDQLFQFVSNISQTQINLIGGEKQTLIFNSNFYISTYLRKITFQKFIFRSDESKAKVYEFANLQQLKWNSILINNSQYQFSSIEKVIIQNLIIDIGLQENFPIFSFYKCNSIYFNNVLIIG